MLTYIHGEDKHKPSVAFMSSNHLKTWILLYVDEFYCACFIRIFPHWSDTYPSKYEWNIFKKSNTSQRVLAGFELNCLIQKENTTERK